MDPGVGPVTETTCQAKVPRLQEPNYKSGKVCQAWPQGMGCKGRFLILYWAASLGLRMDLHAGNLEVEKKTTLVP